MFYRLTCYSLLWPKISLYFRNSNLLFCFVLSPELVGFHQLWRGLMFSHLLFWVFSLFPFENGHDISILKIQHDFSRMLNMKGKAIPNPRHLFSILIKIPINCDSRHFAYALATKFLGAEFTLSNLDKKLWQMENVENLYLVVSKAIHFTTFEAFIYSKWLVRIFVISFKN